MIELLAGAPAAVIARWVAFVGAAIVVGVASYSALILEKETHSPRLLSLARRASGAMFIAHGVRLVQQALAFASDPAEVGAMVRILLDTQWGYAWIAQVIAGAILFAVPALLTNTRSNPGLQSGRAVLILAVVAAPAFQGHAIGSPHYTTLAVAADIVHFAAAALWMGTLLVIATVSLPIASGEHATALIKAFSPYALAGAATLAATGMFASWLHVQSLAMLWSSTYGRLLLLKLSLIGVVAVLGAINWRRLTPRLGQPGGVRALRTSASWEIGVGAAVFLATAILVATALPNE